MNRHATTLFATLGLALALGPPALAQTSDHLSPRFLSCYQRAGRNPVQQSVCGQAEIGAQDGRLNKAYQQVMHQLDADPGRKATLRAEQRSWLKRRDYECNIDGRLVDEGCLVMKTASRADELEGMVHF